MGSTVLMHAKVRLAVQIYQRKFILILAGNLFSLVQLQSSLTLNSIEKHMFRMVLCLIFNLPVIQTLI